MSVSVENHVTDANYLIAAIATVIVCLESFHINYIIFTINYTSLNLY